MPCSCVEDDAAHRPGFQARNPCLARIPFAEGEEAALRRRREIFGLTSTTLICYRSRMVPDAIDLAGVRRVLVTKLRHHGDVLLTSPVLSTLKAAAPHADIDALVYAETAPMLANHPAL